MWQQDLRPGWEIFSHAGSEGSSKRGVKQTLWLYGRGERSHLSPQDSSQPFEEYRREKNPQQKIVHLKKAWGAQKRHFLLYQCRPLPWAVRRTLRRGKRKGPKAPSISSHACVCPFECRNLSQHFANTVPYTLYCLLRIPENCTWWALAWSPVESRRKMLKSELKRQCCFSWLEDDTTEVYPYFVPFSLVLLGLGDFFDETCLFSIKPNKSCLSMYLTKVTSDPIYPLFITVRRVVLRLSVLVLRP